MSSAIKIFQVSSLLKSGMKEEEIIAGFISVNEEAWPPPVPQEYVWTRCKMKDQIRNCPHLLYALFLNEEMVATLTMIYKNAADISLCSSWNDISGHGTLNTHEENGDSVFGIDLSVSPKYQGRRYADEIMQRAFLLSVILANKRGAFLGSRIPSYHRHASKIPVEQYVFGENRDGKTRDPEIRIYQSTGFRTIKIVPGYMEDPDSLNYGVLMFWENPFYKYTRYLKTLTRITQSMTAKIVLR